MIVYKELSSLVSDLGFSARTLYSVSNSISDHYRTTFLPKDVGAPCGSVSRNEHRRANSILFCSEYLSEGNAFFTVG